MTRIWSLNSSLSYEKRWDATDWKYKQSKLRFCCDVCIHVLPLLLKPISLPPSRNLTVGLLVRGVVVFVLLDVGVLCFFTALPLCHSVFWYALLSEYCAGLCTAVNLHSKW